MSALFVAAPIAYAGHLLVVKPETQRAPCAGLTQGALWIQG